MAAPTLSHSAIQGSLKNQMRAKQQQQKKKKKMVLCTPYVTPRVILPVETQEKILQKLVEAIKPLGIAEEREERRKQKILHQQRLRKEKKLKQQDQETDQVTNSEKNLSGQGGRGQSSEKTEKREGGPERVADVLELSHGTKSSSEGQGDAHSKMSIARRKICFGINEVIKGLEKDQMRLVLACQSCKPEMLTQHLIGLAATRNCPATIISNLSTTLCPILQISSLMALGIKKSETEEISPLQLDEAVEFVSGLIPEQTLPWIEKLSSEKGPITDFDTKSEKEDVSLAESASTTVSKDTESLNTQKTAPDTDYSKFYVYKNAASGVKSFGADFIPFSNESATKEVKIPDFGHKRKHETEVKDLAKFRKYQSTGYMPVFGNEQKFKKSKKKKKKQK